MYSEKIDKIEQKIKESLERTYTKLKENASSQELLAEANYRQGLKTAKAILKSDT